MIEMKLFESGLKKTGELLRVVAILLMLPVCLFSATDLQVDVSAMPSLVDVGGTITVLMSVTNVGVDAGINVSPESLSGLGSGTASFVTGPVPLNFPLLSPGGSTYFTWTLNATGPGTLYFDVAAGCTDNGTGYAITSTVASSNVITIYASPTNTQTITPTVTVTVTPTITQTATITPMAGGPTMVPTLSPEQSVAITNNVITEGEELNISYNLLTPSKVRILIYNRNGKLVKTLEDGDKNAGVYNVAWAGKGRFGEYVGSGIYVIYVESGDFKKKFKAVLVR